VSRRSHSCSNRFRTSTRSKAFTQRIQELDRERAALFEQAKEEALQRTNQAVDDLNALGLNYRLVAPSVEKAPAGGKGPAKKLQEAGLADKKRPARPPG
jgi:hypothetical protein